MTLVGCVIQFILGVLVVRGWLVVVCQFVTFGLYTFLRFLVLGDLLSQWPYSRAYLRDFLIILISGCLYYIPLALQKGLL